MMVSYNSDLNRTIRNKIGVENNTVNKKIEKISNNVNQFSKTYFGITHHGVFVDYHFSEYNHNIAVVYKTAQGKEIWLPITNQNSFPGYYLKGPVWAKWGFRVNHNKINQPDLEKGIRDFTAFWAKQKGINLDDADFIIKLKKIDTPHQWEKDFLKNQIQKPWQNIGTAVWKNKQYNIQIPEVEKL